jgi:hypothetical protein
LKFLILILLSLACTKREGVWNELDQAERDYISNRATAKCIADIATAKADFIAESNNFAAHARGDTFQFDYLVKGAATGATPDISRKMVVLKATSTEMYVYLVETDNSVDTKYVIKVDTTDNTAIIDQLVTDHCAKTIKLTNTTGTTWQSFETDEASSEDDSDVDVDKEHTFKYVISQPAFFGKFDYFFEKNSKNLDTGVVTTTNYETTRSSPTFSLPTKATLDAASHCTFTDSTLPYEPTNCASNVYDTTYLSTN